VVTDPQTRHPPVANTHDRTHCAAKLSQIPYTRFDGIWLSAQCNDREVNDFYIAGVFRVRCNPNLVTDKCGVSITLCDQNPFLLAALVQKVNLPR